MKKPALNRETVRVLDERKLLGVRGGATLTDDPNPIVTIEIKGNRSITEDPDPVGGH